MAEKTNGGEKRFFVALEPWGEMTAHSSGESSDDLLRTILGGEPEFAEIRFRGRVWNVATAIDAFDRGLEQHAWFPEFCGRLCIGPLDAETQASLCRPSFRPTTEAERKARLQAPPPSEVRIITPNQVVCDSAQRGVYDSWYVVFNESIYPKGGRRFPTKAAAEAFLAELERNPLAQPKIPPRVSAPTRKGNEVTISYSNPADDPMRFVT